jgi:parallel beta-helix repeat protein
MNVHAVKLLSRGGACVVAVAAAALLAGPGSARVNAVTCGSTITTSVTLVSDLKCPEGLVVSGDGVTLDLGGHILRGTGAGTGVSVTGAQVTVRDGTVRGFREGIRVSAPFPSGDTRLARLSVIRNEVGVVAGSPVGRIEESSVSENTQDGIRMNGATDWTIDGVTMMRNGADGLSLVFTRNVSLRNNLVTGNGRSGIESFVHADLTVVEQNVVAGNARFGITVRDSTTRVLHNVVRNNGATGIALLEDEGGPAFAQFYEITGNVSSKNGGAGITACVRVGDDMCAGGMVDGGGNLARFNGVTPECVNVDCRLHD